MCIVTVYCELYTYILVYCINQDWKLLCRSSSNHTTNKNFDVDVEYIRLEIDVFGEAGQFKSFFHLSYFLFCFVVETEFHNSIFLLNFQPM